MNIFNDDSLKSEGKKVAKLKGNRDLTESIIESKKKSLLKVGQLIPAVLIEGKTALDAELEIIDFETESAIGKNDVDNYVVLLDGNHRYQAHLRLKQDDPEYNNDFYFMYPLVDKKNVCQILAEINIATNPWKGADYGKGAKLLVKDKLPLLDAITELTTENFSLSSASKWLTFTNNINKTILTKAMAGDISPKLKNESGIERGKRLLEAAKEKFSLKVLKPRYFIDWIIKQYDVALDSDKQKIIDDIVNFFKSDLLSKVEVEKIEKAKGITGQLTVESIIYESLDSLFAVYNKTNA